jgi:hypothetical protein
MVFIAQFYQTVSMNFFGGNPPDIFPENPRSSSSGTSQWSGGIRVKFCFQHQFVGYTFFWGCSWDYQEI